MPPHRALPAVLLAIAAPVLMATPATAAPPADVRVGTFNASLNRSADGELVADLSTADDPQAREVAEVVAADPLAHLNDASDHHATRVDLRLP